jgi:tryptophan-rich sensory protein
MIESLLSDRGPALVAFVWLAGVALAGGLMTEVGPWYESLRFPRIRPPNWLFGPAWTTLYILIGIGGVKAWNVADSAQRTTLIAVLAVNTVLNVTWSPLFFKLKRPDWALAEWVPFWISVGVVFATAYAIRPEAGLYFAPYWAWVTFAGWLNWRIVELNRPFSGRAA